MGEGTTTHEAELKNGCLGSSDMQRARYNYIILQSVNHKEGREEDEGEAYPPIYPFQEPSLPPPIKLSN